MTIHSLQYRRDWDDSSAWIEAKSEHNPHLSIATPVKNKPGLYEVSITAPKTLLYSTPREHKGQLLPLPRWYYFMDSVSWGLYAVYDNKARHNDNNDISYVLK